MKIEFPLRICSGGHVTYVDDLFQLLHHVARYAPKNGEITDSKGNNLLCFSSLRER